MWADRVDQTYLQLGYPARNYLTTTLAWGPQPPAHTAKFFLRKKEVGAVAPFFTNLIRNMQ